MIFSILASGSKGNSTYIEINNQAYLIDVGITLSNLTKRLENLKKDVKNIKGIFITHAHSDHIQGLKAIVKKYNPKIYVKEGMLKEIPNDINQNNFEIISDLTELENFSVNVIKTSHDAEESVGYIFNNKNEKICYITDTGYINMRYHDILSNCTAYIIESNHDVEKLLNGKYPYYLKQRILSDKGHLSNQDTAYYLSKLVGNKTKHIVLTHLSEENNSEELAINTITKKFEEEKLELCNLVVANQAKETDLVIL